MSKNMLGVALCDVRGPLADLNEKLSGESGTEWLGELTKFLRKEPTWGNGNGQAAPAPNPIILIVDYGRSLEDGIKAGGYNWYNDDITAKRFPIVGEGKVEFESKLFHFDRDISSDEAKRQMEAEGYEAGKIEHLLVFGEKHSEEQRKHPIIALGSVAKVNGYRYVPSLDRYGSKRKLLLYYYDNVWLADCRFLGVRKKLSVPQA